MQAFVLSAESCWVKTDDECKIIDASASWHKLWGFSREEALGKSTSILDGDCTDKVAGKMLMAQYAEKGAASMSCTNTSKQGAIYHHDLE